MQRLIEKLEDFLEDKRFTKVILNKEEVKLIIDYYNSKGD